MEAEQILAIALAFELAPKRQEELTKIKGDTEGTSQYRVSHAEERI